MSWDKFWEDVADGFKDDKKDDLTGGFGYDKGQSIVDDLKRISEDKDDKHEGWGSGWL